ncbi:MAG: FAD-dependent oxidoreductase [Pontiellaceae bacterium]|nr:FAD-dependent oxidoreductase [Pontiellaceae bacterium]MBN2783750.1 FAD-dependent oxidoreductase [Pontiellaceae bacterium]
MGSSKRWRCKVCGYIHEGDTPPETCPVCGVPGSEFELDAPVPEPAKENKSTIWRCQVCGYLHEGAAPPDTCPVCGVPSSEFEAMESGHSDPEPDAPSTEGTAIVIIGGGIAGLSAAEGARETNKSASITLISGEKELPYYRLNLTRYLAGEIGDEALSVHPVDWYEQQNIGLLSARTMKSVDSGSKSITLDDGTIVPYDKLIITTGAHAFLPAVPGTEFPFVFTLRSGNDAKAIQNALCPESRVVCIGGGILGLETAGALARHGARVTVLEASEHLMPRQLSPEGSRLMTAHLGRLNIEVLMQVRTAVIEDHVVILEDGRRIEADLVVITVGVRPNLEFLAEAGLATERGVLVNNRMETSKADILAAGDVCEHNGVMYGSWAAAQFQGKIAGMNAAGSAAEFGGLPRSHNLKVLGKDMFSIGEIRAADGSYRKLEETTGDTYRMFMLRDGRLIGSLLIGDLELMSAVRTAIEKKSELGMPDRLDELIEQLKAN